MNDETLRRHYPTMPGDPTGPLTPDELNRARLFIDRVRTAARHYPASMTALFRTDEDARWMNGVGERIRRDTDAQRKLGIVFDEQGRIDVRPAGDAKSE